MSAVNRSYLRKYENFDKENSWNTTFDLPTRVIIKIYSYNVMRFFLLKLLQKCISKNSTI